MPTSDHQENTLWKQKQNNMQSPTRKNYKLKVQERRYKNALTDNDMH